MAAVINPFDAGGYTLAEMTKAINLMPRTHSVLAKMNLFRFEGVTQRTVLVEMANGVLNLLPTVRLGGPATVANPETRALRSFNIPWIPHDDVITPQETQGIRAFGTGDASDPLASVMDRKMARMSAKHDLTREYMEMQALQGVLKDGAGVTLNNFYTEFGISQTEVDFVLGTAGTDILGKARTVLRAIEDNLLGESMIGAPLALVSSTFFDKFISHAKVTDAYKYFQNNAGGNPNREDLRSGFLFGGINWQEYNATLTLSTGSTTKMIPDGDGVAFPRGTQDTFVTYGAPANTMETVNTVGLPKYARQLGRRDDSGIDLLTESSPLPINKRPGLSIRVYSSN